MKKMTGKNTLMLFLTAFIWGTAFVAQSVGMDYIGPFTFTCVRSLIGGIFLIPCICFLDKWRAKNDGAEDRKKQIGKKKKRMSSWVESVVDWHFVWQVTCSRSEYSTQRWEKPDLLQHFISCLCRSLEFF